MKNRIQKDKRNYLIKNDILNSLDVPVIVTDKKLKKLSFNRKAIRTFMDIRELSELAALQEIIEEKSFLKNCKAVFKSGKEKEQKISCNGKQWIVRITAREKEGIILLFTPQNAEPKDERYQQLLDSMGDSFMITDESLKIIETNKALCNATGYSREELIGSDFSLIDKNLSRSQIKAIYKKVRKKPYTFDTQNTNSKGESFETEVNIFLLKRGNKPYFGSIGRDVTEYKKAQNELKKKNDRFTKITNATHDALWEINMETGEIWANEIHQQLYGLTSKDPVPPSTEWHKRIHPDYRKKIINGLNKAIRNKRDNWNSEYWFLTGKNKYIYIYDRTYLTYNKSGKLIKMMGDMLDLTKLQNALEELTIQRNLSESIINALPGIFYLLDKNGNLKRWNKNFEIVTGYTARELGGKRATDFFNPKEVTKMKENIREVFQKGKAEMEGHLITKEKESLPYYLGGWKTIFENEECLIGIGMDMSEINKAQARVKQMEQKITAQKISEQKSISRAIIMTQEKERNHIGRELHDNVNQLLAGTRLYLTMGAKKNPEFAEMIKYPVELLDNGIQEIRTLTHRHITPTKGTDLKELTDGIAALLKAADIKCNFKYKIEPSVIDEEMMVNIYRILQEEVNNIIKHSKSKNVVLEVYSENCRIFINTEDDGIGFDINDKREGIGLENIKHRVNTYDGSLILKTSPGKGCSIYITFPIPDCSAPAGR